MPLKGGGSIVIDQTEALVAIDVNSGNFRVELDVARGRPRSEINLRRPSKELTRQLRLRDLGGVIVNDFIDMRAMRSIAAEWNEPFGLGRNDPPTHSAELETSGLRRLSLLLAACGRGLKACD